MYLCPLEMLRKPLQCNFISITGTVLFLDLSSLLSLSLSLSLSHTHTHTHTHILIIMITNQLLPYCRPGSPTIIRAKENSYQLPQSVAPFIHSISRLIDFPPLVKEGKHRQVYPLHHFSKASPDMHTPKAQPVLLIVTKLKSAMILVCQLTPC